MGWLQCQAEAVRGGGMTVGLTMGPIPGDGLALCMQLAGEVERPDMLIKKPGMSIFMLGRGTGLAEAGFSSLQGQRVP